MNCAHFPCLSIMPCYGGCRLLLTHTHRAMIYIELLAVAGQAAQHVQSVGGAQQPPPPTPPAASTAPERLCATAAALAAENRATPSHSRAVAICTSASSMHCPAGYTCLDVPKNAGANSAPGGAVIFSDSGVTLGPEVPKQKRSSKYMN